MSGADFPQPSLILGKMWGNFSLNLADFNLFFDFIVWCWLPEPRGWVTERATATRVDTCARYSRPGGPRQGYFWHIAC